MKKLILLSQFTCYIFYGVAQNVGIGTTTPFARLHVADSSVVFTAAGLAPAVAGNVPISDAGRRMMWYTDKGAFRAGYVPGIQWNKDSIGLYSTATGYGTIASGNRSVAMGNATSARGQYSVAMGSGTIASGDASIAMGISTEATGSRSVAMGVGSEASGAHSVAMGSQSIARGTGAVAIGLGAYSSGEGAAVALGDKTIAIGQSSTALGLSTIAKALGGIAVGLYNSGGDNPNPNTPAATDRIFQIGNGIIGVPSNALTVLRNGNTGIGTLLPESILHIAGAENDGTNATLKIESGSNRMLFDGNEIDAFTTSGSGAILYLNYNSTGDVIMASGGGKVGINTNPSTYTLEVNGTAAKPGGGTWTALSDARMKQNIQPYTDGLQQVLQLKPITFHYNNQSGYNTSDQHVGVIAQELKAVAPYMTGTIKKDGQEYLTADNSAMIYMLVNAVKELAKQNEKLQAQIGQLKAVK